MHPIVPVDLFLLHFVINFDDYYWLKSLLTKTIVSSYLAPSEVPLRMRSVKQLLTIKIVSS